MRTLLVFLTLLILTPVIGLDGDHRVAARRPDRGGSIYDKAPRWWARSLVACGRYSRRLHDEERLQTGGRGSTSATT